MSFLSTTPLGPRTGAENNLSWRAEAIAEAARAFASAAKDLERMAKRQEADYEASQERLKDIQRFLWTALKNPMPLPETEGNTPDYVAAYERGQRHILAVLAEVLGYEAGQINPAFIELEFSKLEPAND